MEFKVPTTPPSVRREVKRASKGKRNKNRHTGVPTSPYHGIEFSIPHMLRMQAIEEFVNSEKIYMCKLNSLMKYFHNPLKELTIITEEIHFNIFGQIEMISNLNAGFLRELEENMMEVGKAFMKITPFFNLYSLYAFNHKFSIYTLHTITNQNSALRSFLREKESRPEVVATLNMLLFAPIQRIQQYKELLFKIMANTNSTEAEHKLLKESMEATEVPCFHIDWMIPGRNAQQLLINLQNSLFNRYPNIIKLDRKILLEGVLSNISNDGTVTDCYCVLMTDIFMCCKILKQRAQNTLVENSLDCDFIYPLRDCKLFDQFPESLVIYCQDDKTTFRSKDLTAALNWILTLTEALDPRAIGKIESKIGEPMRPWNLFKSLESECPLSPNPPSNEYKNIYRNQNMTSSIQDEDPHSETFNVPRRNGNPSGSIVFGSNEHDENLHQYINDKENSIEELFRPIKARLDSLEQLWYKKEERE